MSVIFDPFSGNLIDIGSSSGGILSVEQDPIPTLGGNLSLNGYKIQDTIATEDNANLYIINDVPTETSELDLYSAKQNGDATIETHAQLQVLSAYNGGNPYSSITLVRSVTTPSSSEMSFIELNGSITIQSSYNINLLAISSTGNIVLNNNKIQALKDGVSNDDAASVGQMNTAIGVAVPQSIATSASPTFQNLYLGTGNIDTTSALVTTLAIGGTNASIINIGKSGDTINVQGTTFYQNVTQLQVTDPLITLNKSGSAGSGGASGIEIEENSSITAYAKTSADRNSWTLKAPAQTGIVTVSPGSSGFTIDQGSHNPVTIGTANGLSLSTQALSLQLATASLTGALSSTDFAAFTAKVDGPASSVDGEIALFDSTTGKLVKRATGTGIAHLTSGVLSASAVNLASSDVTGILPFANGGSDATNSSTGLISGGVLSIGTPNTTFSISNGTGIVTDNSVVPGVRTAVSWSGKTNITATYIASGLVSYVAIDSSGNVVQSLTPFTNTQHRQYITLGSLIHVNLTNLDAINQFGEVALSPANQLSDLSEALGKFNIGGNIFSANGANLLLNKSAGNVFAQGSNWAVSVTDPNVTNLVSLTGLTFQYRFQNGTNGATGTSVNPNIYDSAGVSTAVPTNRFTIQRIYSFVSNNVKIQPGQFVYNSLAEAKSAVQTEAFVTETSISNNGILRAFLIVQQGTTNLTNTARAFFYEAGKFTGQIGVGGQSVSSLQNAYDNSISPEILTSSTNGAVTIKRGSAADTDNVLEGQNGSGSTTFSVNGNGLTTVSNLTIDALTGMLKASSGVVSVATSGVDYVPVVTGDITLTSFAGLVNNTANQTLTGLAFSTSISSFEVLMSIQITATADTYTTVKMLGTRKSASDWTSNDIQFEHIGDTVTGLAFDITAAGQVRVTIGSITGFSASTIKFRATIL